MGPRRDTELGRTLRVATIERRDPHHVLLPALYDAAVLSPKPDCWTVTGWERLEQLHTVSAVALVQSWIMIPSDCVDAERAHGRLLQQLREV